MKKAQQTADFFFGLLALLRTVILFSKVNVPYWLWRKIPRLLTNA